MLSRTIFAKNRPRVLSIVTGRSAPTLCLHRQMYRVVKDSETGEIKEIHCTYDPETKSGLSQSSRKVKATIHWLSAAHAVPAEVRLYDQLFTKEDPEQVPEGQIGLSI